MSVGVDLCFNVSRSKDDPDLLSVLYYRELYVWDVITNVRFYVLFLFIYLMVYILFDFYFYHTKSSEK